MRQLDEDFWSGIRRLLSGNPRLRLLPVIFAGVCVVLPFAELAAGRWRWPLLLYLPLSALVLHVWWRWVSLYYLQGSGRPRSGRGRGRRGLGRHSVAGVGAASTGPRTQRTGAPGVALRHGTGLVGRRLPAVLAPGLAPSVCRRWRTTSWCALIAGVVLVGYAVVGLAYGEPVLRVVAAGVPGLGLVLGGELLRRLADNDDDLRAGLEGPFGRWEDVGGGRLSPQDLAALDVTPWGILSRTDLVILLQNAAVAPPPGQPVTVLEVAEAMSELTSRGSRP